MCGIPELPLDHDSGRQRWRLTDALFLGLVIGFALPAVMVRYPLSADYLNHLARLYILGSSPDAPIRQFYEIHWGLIPNLGVDLLWVALRYVASPETVMKTALVGATVGLGLSVWFLHRCVFRHSQPTILLCAACLVNLPSTAGMVNFAIGLPLVFLGLGCWIRMGDAATRRSLLLLNTLGVAAYFAHIAALASLGLTVAAYHCLQEPRSARTVVARAAQIMPGFLVPTLLVIAAVIAGWHDGTVHSGANIAFNETKLFTPLAAFFSGYTAADIATLCATAALVVLCGGPIAPRLRPVLAVWTLVIVAMPTGIGVATYIDRRLAIVPVMLYLSSIAFQKKLVPGGALAALATSLAAIRVLTLVPALHLHDAHVRSFRAIDDRIPRGARVIVASAKAGCGGDQSWELLEEHLPSLLSIDRDAFVSTVFAGDGMQPIRWKVSLRGTGEPNVTAPSLKTLETLASSSVQVRGVLEDSPDVLRSIKTLEGWPEWYDYMAIRDCLPRQTSIPHLLPIARSDTWQIYEIVRSPTAGPRHSFNKPTL